MEQNIANQTLASWEDGAVLRSLEVIMDAIARLFGTECEVVLHDLTDLRCSVIRIVNGHVTGRMEGSPMTDFGLEVLHKSKLANEDVVGCYYPELDSGKILKSVSVIIRNTLGKPIGLLCINIDLSVSLIDFLREFYPKRLEAVEGTVEHFPSSLDQLVDLKLKMAMATIDNQGRTVVTNRNKAIVMELYKSGIFRITGVVDLIANKIGISRYTVYHYIRDAKIQPREEI